MALPKRVRFSSRRDVAAVIRAGRRYQTPLGRVAVAPVRKGETGRVLFSVPTTVSKKSSQRNRIRRHLEEWARTRLLPLRLHYHLVVLVGPDSGAPQRSSLRERAEAMRSSLLRMHA